MSGISASETNSGFLDGEIGIFGFSIGIVFFETKSGFLVGTFIFLFTGSLFIIGVSSFFISGSTFFRGLSLIFYLLTSNFCLSS